MTEKFLHDTKVGPSVENVSSGRMAKCVRADGPVAWQLSQ